MPQAGKNKGNKHAALKPGEVGRVQWTQSLDRDETALLKQRLIAQGVVSKDTDKEIIKAKVIEIARQICTEALEKAL